MAMRKFTVVFELDIEQFRKPAKPGGRLPQPFVLRMSGNSIESIVGKIGCAFEQPLILAAFHGWPKCWRGEIINGIDDVRDRYGPEAHAKRQGDEFDLAYKREGESYAKRRYRMDSNRDRKTILDQESAG